jgi:hypothetical protein
MRGYLTHNEVDNVLQASAKLVAMVHAIILIACRLGLRVA